MIGKRFVILTLGLALVATAVPFAMNGTAVARVGADYLVHGEGAAAAISAGGRLSDDYGAFATGWIPDALATELAAKGFVVEPLAFETGRGAYRFDGRLGDAFVPAALRADGSDVVLVQFRGPVKAEWKAALDATAVAVYEYLPSNTFIARMTPLATAAFAARPEVVFVGAYHPAYKLSTDLPTEGTVDVAVLSYKDADFNGLLLDLFAMGVPARSFADSNAWENVAKVTLPAARLADVARHPAVSWIEPSYDEGAGLDNAESVAITMTGATGNFRVGDLGIDGSSQVTSVCDTGVDTTGGSIFTMVHEMFAHSGQSLTLNVANPAHRKVIMYYAPIENGARRGDGDDADGHGTHTGGTLAGDAPGLGTRNNQDGFGLKSKLMVCDITIGGSFQILSDYANYWNPAYAQGARVNSNSWGSAHTNSYTEKARQHDAYVWTHRDMNILRSMGNTGPNGQIRPEAVAKSAFGIGATNNGASADSMAGFSTRGPTQDNRIKPTVVAPGNCLLSAQRGTAAGYVCFGGTSMSTPSVSGAATLVRDYMVKGYYPTGAAIAANAVNPSTALVRAMLVNSGKQISGDGTHPAPYFSFLPSNAPPLLKDALVRAGQGQSFPNGGQGWGRVTLDDVLYFAGDARKTWIQDEAAGLTTGGTATFTINVADPTQALEVTLAWSDFPAAAGANPTLVNNLDLTVTGPTGVAYNGNVLLNGESSPLPFRDATNVEEAVMIKSPVIGPYTITVTGIAVPSGPQPFALVATGGLA